MKALKVLVVFSLMLNVFAGEPKKVEVLSKVKHYDMAIAQIEKNIGAENTCLDDYLKRERKLKKILIFTPPLTVVATPASFYAGAFAGALLAGAAGITSWDALAFVILGAYGAGVAAATYGIVIETTRGIEFARNRSVINSLIAANNGFFGHRSFRKLLKKFKRRNGHSVSAEELSEGLLALDRSGALCDGSITGYFGKKSRKKLAKNKHILNALR